MFEKGTIVFYDPFYFKNGNTCKPKFFLVLGNVDEGLILASLPTSQNFIPNYDTISLGCIDLPLQNMSAFVIPSDTDVTDCGKRFRVPTFIYGHQIDTYEISKLQSIYPVENVNYTVWGVLRAELFESLIDCFAQSAVVKRKYKRILS